jgi:hypothetical protein
MQGEPEENAMAREARGYNLSKTYLASRIRGGEKKLDAEEQK